MQLIKSITDWTAPKCGKCSKRLFRMACFTRELRENYTAHGRTDTTQTSLRHLCKKCYDQMELTKCCKTGQVFLRKDDKSAEYRESQMRRNLWPYHPSSRIEGSLCRDGLAIIAGEHQELQNRFQNWAGCSKQDYLRGYRIVNEIELIREEGQHNDPAEVEEALKWHCLQIGGNGLTKFFWDKHIRHHEEEYVAGYGKNGNPYHRTRRWTTADFSGYAVAVVAESTMPPARSHRDNKRGGGNGGVPARDHKLSESDCWNILGLSGNVTKEEIRKAYRKAMSEYHPDKVASLGSELRELAERKAKEINEAYNFFRILYDL